MIDLKKQAKRTIMLPMILVFIVMVGMLAISFYYLYGAFEAYARGALQEALYYTLLSAAGIGVTIYMSFMIRKRSLRKKPLPRVITTIECKKCGFKNLRKFEKDDYVFKAFKTCQKCNEPMLITSIYAEEIKK